jgi:hypothetical protein
MVKTLPLAYFDFILYNNQFSPLMGGSFYCVNFMSKDYYDTLQENVAQICSAHDALVQAAEQCQQALSDFSAATQGSSQPEVTETRQGYLAVDSQIQQWAGLLLGRALTLSAYSATLHAEAQPVQLPASTQTLVDQGSPYAQAEPDPDILFPTISLTSDDHQQFTTTVQTNCNNDKLQLEVPGGYIKLDITNAVHGREANVDFVEVTEGPQQGKGTYLIAAAAREASLRGVESMTGFYVSPYSLRALAKVVGENNIIIKSPPSKGLYIQTDNYTTALNELHVQEATPGVKPKGVRARVNLRDQGVQSRLFRR